MFVRLTLADVKEGEMNNEFLVKNTVVPSYDGISGYTHYLIFSRKSLANSCKVKQLNRRYICL